MYQLKTTNRFNRDLRRCKKRGYDLQLLKDVIKILVSKGRLPRKYKPHKLEGKYKGLW